MLGSKKKGFMEEGRDLTIENNHLCTPDRKSNSDKERKDLTENQLKYAQPH